MDVRRATHVEHDAAVARLIGEWGDPILVRGASYALSDCDIFIAGEMAGLAAISMRERPTAELVAINAFEPRRGIGSAIIGELFRTLRADGCTALRLTMTNDNLDALRFYQRRGFRLIELRPGAVDLARSHKPSIPQAGDYGIAIRDELDLIADL
jgi:GNAT superfamily N-acetyltransferase